MLCEVCSVARAATCNNTVDHCFLDVEFENNTALTAANKPLFHCCLMNGLTVATVTF